MRSKPSPTGEADGQSKRNHAVIPLGEEDLIRLTHAGEGP